MSKQQQISAIVLASIAKHNGDVQAGFDAVFGEGAYLKLAGEVWRAARVAQGLSI